MSNAVTADGPLIGRGDRDDATAGAQVGDAVPGRQPGARQHIDEQMGVMLWGIHALRGDRSVAGVDVGGCHVRISALYRAG